MIRVYWKGKLWPSEKIRISPLNTGLFFGENLFEAVPVYRGRPLFFKEHLRRLQEGCHFLHWPFLPESEFRKAISLFDRAQAGVTEFMIRFNLVQEIKGQPGPHVYPKGTPILFATTRPLRHSLSQEFPTRGKVGLGTWIAADDKTLPHHFKLSFYLTTRADFREHPDWDEILRLSREGFVVDGGLSTPLWFTGKKVLAPPLFLGGLASVTRKKILKLVAGLGIRIEEKPWKPNDIFGKGELFFVGSGVGVFSPTHLQNRKINRLNPFATVLWQSYRKLARDKVF